MQKTTRFNHFDLLRIIAATLVVYAHSYPLLGLSNPPDIIHSLFGSIDSGRLGVLIFFTISGYLNAKSVSRTKTTLFLINRSLRIFPGLFVALLISAFVIGPVCTSLPLPQYFASSQTWVYIYHNILLSVDFNLPGVFENNLYKGTINGSLWTLPTEFVLYLILPIAIKSFDNKLRTSIFLAAIFLILHLIFTYTTGLPINTYGLGSLESVTANSFAFFAGAVIAYSGIEKTSKLQLTFLIALIFATSQTLYAPIALLIILPMLIIKIGSLNTRYFTFKNDISYGLYIYAFPVQQATWHFLHATTSPLIMSICSMSTTIIFAALSWHLVEKPILANRNHISSKLISDALYDSPDIRTRT